MSHAYGNPLTRLAAIAHARVQRHVVANSADVFQRGRTVAYQRGSFDRRANLAIFNAISFGARKNELVQRLVISVM